MVVKVNHRYGNQEKTVQTRLQKPLVRPPVSRHQPSVNLLDPILNKPPSEELVTQPSHRTISIDIPEETIKEISVSVIGITKEDNWADILQEQITLSTCFPTKVIGISHRKFLVSFPTLESKNDIPLPALRDWFMEKKEATHRDLIPPRIAWMCTVIACLIQRGICKTGRKY